jgi:hypothetical protein
MRGVTLRWQDGNPNKMFAKRVRGVTLGWQDGNPIEMFAKRVKRVMFSNRVKGNDKNSCLGV